MVIVDPEDEWLLHELGWYITDEGYVRANVRIDGMWTTRLLHHYIVGTPIWEGDLVDHINRNKLDNRRCNLRICSASESSINRSLVSRAQYISRVDNTFIVRIRRNNKLYYIGALHSEEEAIAARDEFFKEHPEMR